MKKQNPKNKISDVKSGKVRFLEKTLRILAVLILKKYNPKIVGITGSVGKTSAKEAIFVVLAGHYRVRKNEKNYNNEIGLPLTVIGSESGGNSAIRWLGVFLKALGVLLFPAEYPEILVLEMGADRPGDIRYLTSFLRCASAVLTDISGSHLEFFGTVEKVGEEKWSLVDNLPSGATAALNIDNPNIARLKKQSKRDDLEFIPFGFSDEALLKAGDVFYNYSPEDNSIKQRIRGLSFKLSYKGTTIPVRLNNVLASYNIYAALAGTAIGLFFKLNLVEIAGYLENFSLPCGRMNLLPGLKNSSIIDDSYNSSPVSAKAAIQVMGKVTARRRLAVLGDMLELGSGSEAGHKEVVEEFFSSGGDILLTVGERMEMAVREKEKTAGGRILSFSDPMKAGRKLQEIIQPGDLILVKGSQGMRMEKVVEEVMAEPEKSEIYLCRQDAKWKETPWKKV